MAKPSRRPFRFAMVILPATFNVNAGSSQIVTIRFSPNSAAAQTGTRTIASNDPVHPSVLISLAGNSTTSGPPVVTLGQTVTGTLSAASGRAHGCSGCYADVYLLTIPGSQGVDIRLNSSAFDTYLQIIDTATGLVVAADDDSGGGTNSRLLGTLFPGTYLIEATTAFAGDSGGYSLSVISVVF